MGRPPKETSLPKGRPRRDVVKSKTKGSRGVVGRPKGDASIINEYKARMLASPRSEKVLNAIYDAALDAEHKNQAAAWKLIMDRFLPLSYFEKDGQNSGRASISINITGVGEASPAEIVQDITDVEVRDD